MERPISALGGNDVDKSLALATEHEHAAEHENENDLFHTRTTIDVLEVTQKNPYLEPNFIGTFIATGLAGMVGYGGFLLPATSLALIDADIGPSPNLYWVPLAWTLCQATGYVLVGRLSDIFGRRWFLVAVSLMACAGCVVGATANNINQLIGAEVLIGFAGAGQTVFAYTVGELVPVKHRGFVLAGIYTMIAPISVFGPYIARLFIVHTAKGWRWDFYLMLIINGISTTLYFFCYHPPKFEALHRHRTRMQEIKDFDYVGTILFLASTILFVMGITWGGSAYPWKSAHVVATILIGFALGVAFVLYECYMSLRRPLIPMHLFRNRGYWTLTTVTTVGGMLYFSMNIIYPTMVAVLFTTDIAFAGLLICAIGGGVAIGQIVGAFFSTLGGHVRWKILASTVCLTAFSAAMAGANTRNTATALVIFAAISIGVLESVANNVLTIVIEDQTELGAGVGTFSTLRDVGGTIASAVFTTVLTNKVTANTKSIVVPAIVKAGLPITSVEAFLTALASGNVEAVLAVPMVTKEIIGVGEETLKTAYSNSFHVVWLICIAFGGLAIIASLLYPNNEERFKSHDVVRRLDSRKAAYAVETTDIEEKPSAVNEKP